MAEDLVLRVEYLFCFCDGYQNSEPVAPCFVVIHPRAVYSMTDQPLVSQLDGLGVRRDECFAFFLGQVCAVATSYVSDYIDDGRRAMSLHTYLG